MLNPIMARFVATPSLVAPEMREWFESCLAAAAAHPRTSEMLTDLAESDDGFWPAPDDWRAAYRPYVVQDGILQIPVKGVLLHGFSFALGGWATGYVYIWRAFQRGIEDPNVRGIALICDSPGGHVAGNFDLVDRMYALRGTKKVWAFAHEGAYSAAYSIASVADTIWVSRTGGVGSIGVVAAHLDVSGAMEQAGMRVTFIFAGRHKVDGNAYEALPDEVRERLQSRIDELYGVFTATVSRNRGLGLTPATVVSSNVVPKLSEAEVTLPGGSRATEVPVQYPYGWAARVKAPTKDAGGVERAAETHVLTAGGNRSHPIAFPPSDRRFPAPKLKEGESAHHDDQKQISKIGRDGHELTAKKVEITGGGDQPKGDTANHEMNEFMKGVRADIAQIKDSHHALFDVVSKLRVNAETVLPALAAINVATQVTSALNGLPAGLDAMKALAEGKLQNFFQNAAKDALASFLDPSRLLNVASLLSGGVEGLIAAVKAQIASLIAANPIVTLVDDLKEELAAVTASGGDPAIIAAKAAELTAEIAAHTAANAVVGQVTDLRETLQGYLDTAGAALHFLAVQKRAAQGLVKSVKFGP